MSIGTLSVGVASLAEEPIAGGTAAALSGAVTAQAQASGDLSTQISLAGAALNIATANGTLTTQIPLQGAAVSLATVQGSLLAQITLSGAALVQALAAGTLTSGSSLAGSAQAQAQASGALTAQITLSGAVEALATATGSLNSNAAALVGNAQATASSIGTLTTSIPLTASAIAVAVATGSLTIGVSLAGAAISVATSAGALSGTGPTISRSIPLNYYAAEKAIVERLRTATSLANVFAVQRLMHIPNLFERIAPSPTIEQLNAMPLIKHGAAFVFFSGLDSVESRSRNSDCELSNQEWHIFVFTRYHQNDFERSVAREINGTLTAGVIQALLNFEWLSYYYSLKGVQDVRGISSNLQRVSADKLLVAETRAIEDPTLAETLLAYRAMYSSQWKGIES